MCEVKIDDMILENIETLVIDNVNIPVLFGQTVFDRNVSIEIANLNGEIIFK